MLLPFLSTYRHMSFLQVAFMLVILLLAVNAMSLPFGASAMGLAEKEIYPRGQENFGFLEGGRWKALAVFQKRGLGGRGKQVTGLKKQKNYARSEPFQEVSGNHPTGHSADRGTVAVIVGLVTLVVAGFMV
ncbi:hypothetical protein BGX38DRAFT_533216 [Terfezia claveryi]|nr:hypothetical protein BGX38DRAFT_533216 [Terfezia claveryi]